MGTTSLKALAAAGLLAAMLVAGSMPPALADELRLAASPPSDSLATPGPKESPTANALRRGTAAPALAQRTYCRDQARALKLFGLGRHKFLQRCRRDRRKARQAHPGRPM